MLRMQALILCLLSPSAVLAAGDWNVLDYITRKKEVGISLNNYCESWKMNMELNNIQGFDVLPGECIDYIGKYMTSTQSKADLQRTAEECTLFLTNNFALGGDGLDAWIFDIDDTLLSTEPYYKKLQFGCPEDFYTEVQSYKEQRKKLMKRGYLLWGIVGDQWSSLLGHSNAKRTFKLPNPTYHGS